MKFVILAGGYGTRMGEETEFKPKPMVEIGGKPILWHIMKNASEQGFDDFIICLGYKGEVIREYFEGFSNKNDLNTFSNQQNLNDKLNVDENWRITLADTGVDSMTGDRLLKIAPLTNKQDFLCTYGDGLSDVSINNLIKFHKEKNKIATVTASRIRSRFGCLEINAESEVTSFMEKPLMDNWVNSGYFVFKTQIFNYLKDGGPLELEPLDKLAKDSNLSAYKHNGFWQPIDTIREVQELNASWNTGVAPWKNWA
jgi:glucose-1-phosphate cytidylyltransferase